MLDWLLKREEKELSYSGYMPILNKAMYFKNTRFRENLIRISALCGETQITSFVNAIEDIEVLFNNLTPNVADFLDNCFNKNSYCYELDNLNWKQGDSLRVMGFMTPLPDKFRMQGFINSDSKPSERQNKIIDTQILAIDWVYKSHDGSKTDFRELVEMLGEVENEKLFSTDLVKVLVEYFWDFYYDQIFMKVFIPFVIYFCLTIFYFSSVVTEELPDEKIFAPTWEFALRNFLLLATIYFLWYEVKQIG